MAGHVTISVRNTFEMRKADNDRPAKYHRGHMSTEWQRDLIMSFQQDDVFLQQVERGDRFRFEYSCTAYSSRVLTVIDCHGITKITLVETATADIAGNLSPSGDAMHTVLHKLNNLNSIAADGLYYLLLTIDFGGGEIKQYISHPFLLQDYHEGTALIESKSSINNLGIFDEQLPTTWPLRVPGYIDNMDPSSEDTIFEDQTGRLDQLYGLAFNVWTFFVGHEDVAIPDWLYSKLNKIFTCDSIKIDGRQYWKNIGSKWAKQKNPVNPLQACSIELRDDPSDEGEFGNGTLLLYMQPSFPYVIQALQMGERAPTLVLAIAEDVPDAPAQTALVAALNASLSDLELEGSFVETVDGVFYQNADGESYSQAYSNIYTTYFTVHITTPAINHVLALNTVLARAVVDWGDGAVELLTSGGSLTARDHTYALVGSYSVKIWGQVGQFNVVDPHVTDVSGSLPGGLTLFQKINGTFAANTFDWNILALAQGTLETLIVTDNGLTGAVNSSAHNYTELRNIDFSNNAMSSTTVSNFMYDVWYNVSTNNIYTGNFSIVSQTPPATLNPAGAAKKSILQVTYLWNVTN